ncbi:MAG: GTP pyrophosphokinase family protein [Lachnospiraceae bacterium]|nr:GTP pyrophosphokinase family protein [Lachnospiraceae bacterium]
MIFSRANEMLDEMLDIKELLLAYSAAIQEIRTKLSILNKEYEVRYQRNPINNIQSRLKSQVSIMQKLEKKGLLISRENIEENIYDIAGVRVICSYEDDIYRMAEALTKQADIELVRVKDYIKEPKPNGYRSLHLIVKVPVYFEESVKKVYAEIQIRTVAMDFWASLEHQMKYKKKNIENPEHVMEQLRQCSDMITLTDRYMMKIRKEMDGVEPEKSEVEQLMEKLKRFGVQLAEE